jgi:filamentous hemagglutinin family protein
MIARIASPLWVRLLSVLAMAGLVAAGRGVGHAAVVLDGKFGTSGALTGPNYGITASMGAIRGNNLFHSFSQFDLNAGDVAAFSGPANIQNILSRVTGGSPSSINGTIRSDIAGANFFLINPSGVMFGPNAAVNVSGSFAVSTANYLKLADGARFVAALDADDSMLSSAPVKAFGFLDGANGVIQVKGSLKAAPGTSLSVVGSDVSVVDGTRLEALNGRINLAGVTAPGEWTIPASSSAGNGTPTGSAESIVIRAGRLVVENARINGMEGGIDIALTEGLELLNGGQITTSAAGASKGGNIAIDSPSVLIDGQDNGTTPTRVLPVNQN